MTQIFVEVGAKRVFAGGIDWPGWCRSGKDESLALEALATNAARYAKTLGAAATKGFVWPTSAGDLDVVSRVRGDATTDFGAPSVAPPEDARPLSDTDEARHLTILRASWRALDRSASRAAGAELAKGPRGGGRDLDEIVAHVFEADIAYLSRLGWRFDRPEAPAPEVSRILRGEIIDALHVRIAGNEPPPNPRRKLAPWLPRTFLRRAAWHALDHTWEIEDRAAAAAAASNIVIEHPGE